MLQGIFNYNNPMQRFIGELGDLIILNILRTVCSTPASIAGASTTAVCCVTLGLVWDEDDSIIRSFFRSFKSNLKQAVTIWLILLAAGIMLGLDFWFFASGQMSLSGTVKTTVAAVSGGLLLIYLFIITYMFPLQTRFYNPAKRTLFNAFFTPVRHLFQTIRILATDLGAAAATYFGLFCFPQFAMLLSPFGMPLIASVNSCSFIAIFRKYMSKEEKQEHTNATLLLGEEDEGMKETVRDLKGE